MILGHETPQSFANSLVDRVLSDVGSPVEECFFRSQLFCAGCSFLKGQTSDRLGRRRRPFLSPVR